MRSTTGSVILAQTDVLPLVVESSEEPTHMVSVLKHYRRPPNPKCALKANRESICYVIFLSTTNMHVPHWSYTRFWLPRCELWRETTLLFYSLGMSCLSAWTIWYISMRMCWCQWNCAHLQRNLVRQVQTYLGGIDVTADGTTWSAKRDTSHLQICSYLTLQNAKAERVWAVKNFLVRLGCAVLTCCDKYGVSSSIPCWVRVVFQEASPTEML
jgi:hypothetical protein